MKNIFFTLGTIVLAVVLLYFGKGLLIPFALSTFFRLILSYQNTFFVKKTYVKSKYILIGIYILFILGSGFALGKSATYLQENVSSLSSQVEESFLSYESKIKTKTFITGDDISNRKTQAKDFLSLDMIGGIATGTLGGLATGLLIIVLGFLMFLYEDRILFSITKLCGSDTKEVFLMCKETVGQYCLGLILLVGILFVLNSIGLFVLGVPYALLIGGFSAIATLVPTVGTIVGGLLATIVGGFLTGSIWVALGIFIWYLTIQQIEEYFILPKVVGEKVSLNPLASISAMFARGILRGVAGLFLAIPIMGIIQKMGDKYNKRYAILLSNDKLG